MNKLDSKGQALVEYVVIIGLVTVLVVGLVSYFGGFVKDAMTKTGCQLVGQEYKEGDKPGEGTCINKSSDLDSLFK